MIKKIVISDELELTPPNYMLQTIDGLGYSTKYSMNEILSRHGARLGNSVFRNKVVNIGLSVYGTTIAEHIAKRNDLYKYLTVDNYSTDDKISLEFVRSDNLSLVLSGVLRDVNNPIGVGMTVESMINFSLETEFPFLKSKQLYSVIVPVATDGGAAVPMEIPLDMTAGASSFAIVPNGGNIFSYPTIRIYGPATNPILEDVLNDREMSFQVTLGSGDWYEIDTFERTVVDQTGANKLDELIGDFLIVPASTENQFRLLTDSSLETGYAQIIYPYTYVSI